MIKAIGTYTLDNIGKMEGINKDNALTFMMSLKGKQMMYPSDNRPQSVMGRVSDVTWNQDTQEITLEVEMHEFSIGFGYIIGKGINNTMAYEAILYQDNKNVLVAHFKVDEMLEQYETRLREAEKKIEELSTPWYTKIKSWIKRK